MREEATVLVIDDSDGTDNLDEVITVDVIAMALVELECPNAECNLGPSGAKYKTPALEAGLAMEMLKLHVQQNHVQGQVTASTHPVIKNMRERQKKPSADVEMTEAKWRDFENQWARYK